MYALSLWADVPVALLFIAAGFRYGARLYSRGVRFRSRLKLDDLKTFVVCLLLYVILISLYGIMIHDPALGFFLPVAIEYFFGAFARLCCVAMLGFVSAATIRVALLERHPSRWILSWLCLAFLVGTPCTFAWIQQTYEGHLVQLRGPRVSPEGIVLQSSGSSCAAASCANIARHFGVEKTEEEMVKLFGTNENGTTTAQMILGMRSLGFHWKKRYSWTCDPSAIHFPAVLLVGPSDMHAVALMKAGDDSFEVWDPLKGKSVMNRKEFRIAWGGRAVEFWK